MGSCLSRQRKGTNEEETPIFAPPAEDPDTASTTGLSLFKLQPVAHLGRMLALLLLSYLDHNPNLRLLNQKPQDASCDQGMRTLHLDQKPQRLIFIIPQNACAAVARKTCQTTVLENTTLTV